MDKWIYNPKTLAKRLREKRKEAGFTSQEKFATAYNNEYKKTGNTSGILGSIKNYESGKYDPYPNLDIIQKFSHILNCDPGYLLGFYDEKTKDLHDVAVSTGLSESAIKNLLDIKELCPFVLLMEPTGKDLLSILLSSEFFMQLMINVFQLAILSTDLEENLTVLKTRIVHDFQWEEFEAWTQALKYGRYSFVESCNHLLDSICPRPVDEIVSEAEQFLTCENEEEKEALSNGKKNKKSK